MTTPTTPTHVWVAQARSCYPEVDNDIVVVALTESGATLALEAAITAMCDPDDSDSDSPDDWTPLPPFQLPLQP
jgi:hypothetical protein